MKNDTSFKVFFLKQYRQNSLKTIVFPWESVFTAIAIWQQGHRTTQNAHCAVVLWWRQRGAVPCEWCMIDICPHAVPCKWSLAFVWPIDGNSAWWLISARDYSQAREGSPAGGTALRLVFRDLFPWSIKSAPPTIPFDTPVTGMVAGEAPQQITTTYSPYLSILQTVTSSEHDKFSCTYHMSRLQWRSDSLQKNNLSCLLYLGTYHPAILQEKRNPPVAPVEWMGCRLWYLHLSLICLIALLVCHFTIQMLSADHFHLDTALVPE